MLVVGCISQKGGVGKSTLARDLAVQLSKNSWQVKIADLDTAQTTSCDWAALRMDQGHKPQIQAEAVTDLKKSIAQAVASGFQVLIFDAKPHSSKETQRIAEVADLLVLPTGTTFDDLSPQVRLGMELAKRGVSRERIMFVLNNVASDLDGLEVRDAREFISNSNFGVAKVALPKRQAYQLSQNQGRSISETQFKSLRLLAEEVASELATVLVNQTKGAA